MEFEFNLTMAGMQSNNSGIVNLINSYKCGSLDESLFNTDSKRFIHQGFSITVELDRKAQEVKLIIFYFNLIKCNLKILRLL
ncbi:unnamed protein product [Brugia timori]|uniref:Uncharacterized protein n=1 Tax=Brugia timori TaxID=42155 RepID=A0A3P7U7D2_9BILA|nr:unnamed protein product [Brugia timori]